MSAKIALLVRPMGAKNIDLSYGNSHGPSNLVPVNIARDSPKKVEHINYSLDHLEELETIQTQNTFTNSKNIV